MSFHYFNPILTHLILAPQVINQFPMILRTGDYMYMFELVVSNMFSLRCSLVKQWQE